MTIPATMVTAAVPKMAFRMRAEDRMERTKRFLRIFRCFRGGLDIRIGTRRPCRTRTTDDGKTADQAARHRWAIDASDAKRRVDLPRALMSNALRDRRPLVQERDHLLPRRREI